MRIVVRRIMLRIPSRKLYGAGTHCPAFYPAAGALSGAVSVRGDERDTGPNHEKALHLVNQVKGCGGGGGI
ncbi:hypothetical protein [Nocardia jiangsuensis]|uniref:Uncharacterized protein n=1 Tax=Nocardia jiangsuensis TaxID=1691563 RepID=A0ABV8DVT6_9NOCA